MTWDQRLQDVANCNVIPWTDLMDWDWQDKLFRVLIFLRNVSAFTSIKSSNQLSHKFWSYHSLQMIMLSSWNLSNICQHQTWKSQEDPNMSPGYSCGVQMVETSWSSPAAADWRWWNPPPTPAAVSAIARHARPGGGDQRAGIGPVHGLNGINGSGPGTVRLHSV